MKYPYQPDSPQLYHVVLVEDDDTLAYAYCRYLEQHGFHVTVADDGEKALKIGNEIKIDALIVDYRLYGMNGLEVISALRKTHPDLPAIIVSAYTDDFQITDANTKILRKPVSLILLANAVRGLLVG